MTPAPNQLRCLAKRPPLLLALFVAVACCAGGGPQRSTVSPKARTIEPSRAAGPFAVSLKIVNQSEQPDEPVERLAHAAFEEGARGATRFTMRANAAAAPLLITITVLKPTHEAAGLRLSVLTGGDLEYGRCHVLEFDSKLTMAEGNLERKADFDDMLRTAVMSAAKKLDEIAPQIPRSCAEILRGQSS